MKIALTFVALVFMTAGMAVSWYAWSRYRSPASPARIPAWGRKHWRPLWRMRDRFSETRGFRMYWVGIEMACLGAVVGLVVFAFL
jgi:hypothetical protein